MTKEKIIKKRFLDIPATDGRFSLKAMFDLLASKPYQAGAEYFAARNRYMPSDVYWVMTKSGTVEVVKIMEDKVGLLSSISVTHARLLASDDWELFSITSEKVEEPMEKQNMKKQKVIKQPYLPYPRVNGRYSLSDVFSSLSNTPYTTVAQRFVAARCEYWKAQDYWVFVDGMLQNFVITENTVTHKSVAPVITAKCLREDWKLFSITVEEVEEKYRFTDAVLALKQCSELVSPCIWATGSPALRSRMVCMLDHWKGAYCYLLYEKGHIGIGKPQMWIHSSTTHEPYKPALIDNEARWLLKDKPEDGN